MLPNALKDLMHFRQIFCCIEDKRIQITSECSHHRLNFEDSMNAQAIWHEGAMVDVYSKMKPDSFMLQLQTILTAHFEDIKGVVSASGCTKSKTPRWSGASSRT